MTIAPPPPKLKLVVRHLPPTLPQHIFWDAVKSWCEPIEQGVQGDRVGKVLWRNWIQGRVVDENNLHQVFSRAYVLMTNVDDAITFHKEFDGHLFRSKDGQEYRALIELAPSQKVPPHIQAALSTILKGTTSQDRKGKNKVRVDGRQGTIDQDPDYLSFLESMNQPVTKPRPEDFISPTAPQTNSTPLLDHLREIRVAKRALKDKANEEKGSSSRRSGGDEKVNRGNTTDRGKGKGTRGGVAGGSGGGSSSTTSRQPPSSTKPTTTTPVSNQTQQPRQISILKREGGIPNGKSGNGPSVPPPNPSTQRQGGQQSQQQQQQPQRHPPPAQRQNQQRQSQNPHPQSQSQSQSQSQPNPNAAAGRQPQRRPDNTRPPPSNGTRHGLSPGVTLLSAAISASTGTTIGKGEDGRRKRVRTKKGRGEQNGDGANGSGVGAQTTGDPKEARIDG